MRVDMKESDGTTHSLARPLCTRARMRSGRDKVGDNLIERSRDDDDVMIHPLSLSEMNPAFLPIPLIWLIFFK